MQLYNTNQMSYRYLRKLVKRESKHLKQYLIQDDCVLHSPKENLLEVALDTRHLDIIELILYHPKFNPNCRPCEMLRKMDESSHLRKYANVLLSNPKLNYYVFGPQLRCMASMMGLKTTKSNSFHAFTDLGSMYVFKEACDQVIQSGVDCISFMTCKLSHPTEFITLGFVPSNSDYHLHAEKLLLGEPEEIRRFWGEYNTFNGHYEWEYYSDAHRKTLAVENCNPFLLFCLEDLKSLLYKSHRPKTDMKLFQNPNYKTYRKECVYGDQVLIETEIVDVIPVTRYAESKAKGLYFRTAPRMYTGTFYYLEPDSTTLLVYNPSKTVVYRNKYQAVCELCPEAKDVEFKSPYKIQFLEGTSTLPNDLMMTPKELCKFVDENNLNSIEILFRHGNRRWLEKVPDEKRYVGKHLELYASEDCWDKILYKVGKEKGIETFIFEEMVGGRQIVKEVFDLRDRNMSFYNLVYLEDDL